MGAYINKHMLMGNLGADPETRYSGNGTAITELRIATTSTWRDKDGNKQERTEWHRAVFFGKLAEVCGEYLHKGDKIYVEGESRTEQYTDKDGVERWSTKVYGNEMKMVNTKGGDGEKSQTNGGGQKRDVYKQSNNRNQSPPPEQHTFDDDDIPFN